MGKEAALAPTSHNIRSVTGAPFRARKNGLQTSASRRHSIADRFDRFILASRARVPQEKLFPRRKSRLAAAPAQPRDASCGSRRVQHWANGVPERREMGLAWRTLPFCRQFWGAEAAFRKLAFVAQSAYTEKGVLRRRAGRPRRRRRLAWRGRRRRWPHAAVGGVRGRRTRKRSPRPRRIFGAFGRASKRSGAEKGRRGAASELGEKNGSPRAEELDECLERNQPR